ncbi:MAG: GIY-YIG nuclease family protein [Gammaproteobacteria bacterium]|nr:GIY-YIG nuclease family protein [Gammaproteobacteria bacterium]
MTAASKGIVYVLTNPAMPDLVKIGKTRQKDLNDRLTQLYSTGVPVPFECAFAGVVEDEHKVERAFHKAFHPYRLNPKREFFKIDADQAIALLEILVDEEVTSQVSEQAAQVDPDSRKASDKLRRPNFNFTEMGIPAGAELVFARGGEHKCYVVDDRRVEYDGETLSMTALTVRMLDAPRAVAPLPHWLYNGQRLSEIYEETYR